MPKTKPAALNVISTASKDTLSCPPEKITDADLQTVYELQMTLFQAKERVHHAVSRLQAQIKDGATLEATRFYIDPDLQVVISLDFPNPLFQPGGGYVLRI